MHEFLAGGGTSQYTFSFFNTLSLSLSLSLILTRSLSLTHSLSLQSQEKEKMHESNVSQLQLTVDRMLNEARERDRKLTPTKRNNLLMTRYIIHVKAKVVSIHR